MDKQKLLFAILKEFEVGNNALTHEDFKITEDELHETINLTLREGLINGVYHADDIPHYERAKVTMKGQEYLEKK